MCPHKNIQWIHYLRIWHNLGQKTDQAQYHFSIHHKRLLQLILKSNLVCLDLDTQKIYPHEKKSWKQNYSIYVVTIKRVF